MYEEKPTNHVAAKKLQLTFDYRLVCVVLLIAIGVMLFLWKPWNSTGTDRKVSVTGQATIKAAPDEYVLNPYFVFTGPDDAKDKRDAAAQATQVSAKLKELGVKDTQISSTTDSYDNYQPVTNADGTVSSAPSINLRYTITLSDKAIAQKAQDYFLGSGAKGQLSPIVSFSDAKQKSLEADARDKAIADAKTKATKSAEQVGAKLGKVVTIADQGTGGGCGGGGLCNGINLSTSDIKASASPSIPVQSGLNEFTFSVQVEYQLR